MALALLALFAAVAAPALGEMLARRSLDIAVSRIAGEFARARQEAIARGRYVGIAFEVGAGGGRYAVYLDGGPSGIRAGDIAAGHDKRIRGPVDLMVVFDGVRLGIPASVPIPRIPPSKGVLAAGGDPVQFGGTNIVSFSPRGEASSGSLYLTDRRGGLRAVVLYGRTGRIRVWRWVPESNGWRQ